MSKYVISDIHGHYDSYIKMLDKIGFSENDILYILGDIIDRGPHPIKVLLDLMNRTNVVCIAGNHEVMFSQCMKMLLKEITEDSIKELDESMIESFINWQNNGSITTLNEFYKLDMKIKQDIVEFVSKFELYEKVQTDAGKFILVHAGLGNFRNDKELWEYELEELVWMRPCPSIKYFDDKYVVIGHTPTMYIKENIKKGYIFNKNNIIMIDCGCGMPEGRLGCLRLDDMQEFYVKND